MSDTTVVIHASGYPDPGTGPPARSRRRRASAAAGLLALVAVASAPLVASPAVAQEADSYRLEGDDVAVYDLVGEIVIEPTTGNEVVVQVTRAGADAGRLRVETGEIGGRETLRVIFPGDRIVFPEMGDGETTVRVRDDGTFGGDDDEHGGDRGREVEVADSGSGLEAHADLRILVPAGKRTAVYLGVGDTRASGIEGDLTLDSHSGNVRAEGTRGDLLVDTGAGSVTVRDCDGDITIDTGAGSVELDDIRGPRLLVDTGAGSIAGTDIDTSELVVDTGAGSVELAAVSAPEFRIDTGAGEVELELAGDVESGVVDTGAGSVTVSIPSGLGAEISAEAGMGNIDVDAPIRTAERNEEGDLFLGVAGDGDGRIVIDTGTGGIRLRGR